MEEPTRTELEAAVFRRLVAHLRRRADVQNIDLMIVGGFCRNCLGDWYREAAAEKGIALDKDEAREIVYGMSPSEWKTRYQKEATPEQSAAFAASQKSHSEEGARRCTPNAALLYDCINEGSTRPSRASC